MTQTPEKDVVTVYEEGDRFVTMTREGVARMWEVRGGVPCVIRPASTEGPS